MKLPLLPLLLAASLAASGQERGAPLYALLEQASGAPAAAMPPPGVFRLRLAADPDGVYALYRERAPGWTPPRRLVRADLEAEFNSGQTALAVLSRLTAGPAPDSGTYELPLVLTHHEIPSSVKASDGFYRAGPCAGQGVLEAQLKGGCGLAGRRSYGLIEASEDLVYYGETEPRPGQIPDNGVHQSLDYLLYKAVPALLGLRSLADERGFNAPLSTFDRRLYSEHVGRAVRHGDTFGELAGESRVLEFRGEKARQAAGGGRVEAAVAADGGVELQLKNTILSGSEFVNYGFYTELELAVLSDLGWPVQPREYYGRTVSASGTADFPNEVEIEDGYSAWDSARGRYIRDRVSRAPLSVGTHVTGSYNLIRQRGPVASLGPGAVGVRVDGVGNGIVVPREGAVIENGAGGTGIAVSYGRDNRLELDGLITASGPGGAAVRLSFGSNARSDLHEYRGSYVRARSDDARLGRLTPGQAAAAPLPDELRGPLVRRVNVSGSLSGSAAAIEIGDTAWVGEINFLRHATVRGDIVSFYEPYIENGSIYVRPRRASPSLYAARLQYEPTLSFGDYYGNAKYLDRLHTEITFGALAEGLEDPERLLDSYAGDRSAVIDINGSIVGSGFEVRAVGGVASIRGSLDVSSLSVYEASLHLIAGEGDALRVRDLYLDSGAALNLANSRADALKVARNAFISSEAVIKVDAAGDGRVLDSIEFGADPVVSGGLLRVEPCLSLAELKRYNADPKAFMAFLTRFALNASAALGEKAGQVQVPSRVWYKTGVMGRKVRCAARGCRIGRFVSSRQSLSFEYLPAWRIALSAGGCLALLLAAFLAARAVRARPGA